MSTVFENPVYENAGQLGVIGKRVIQRRQIKSATLDDRQVQRVAAAQAAVRASNQNTGVGEVF